MKKRTFYLILFLLLQLPAFSQSWVWNNAGLGTGPTFFRDTKVDSQKDIYLLGNFYQNFKFGSFYTFPFSSNAMAGHENSNFLLKIDSSSTVKWMRKSGNRHSNSSLHSSLKIDSDDNIYMLATGGYDYFTRYDTIRYEPLLNYQVKNREVASYLVKYDKDGNYVWSKLFNTTDVSLTHSSIEIDNQNNVYICGNADTLFYDFDTLSRDNASNYYFAYIIKLDENGNQLLQKQFNSSVAKTNNIKFTDFQVDHSGNMFGYGVYSDTIDLGGGFRRNTSGQEAFLAKWDASGNILWTFYFQRTGNSGIINSEKFTLDASGNAYLSGYFRGSDPVMIGDSAFTSNRSDTDDIFFARINSDGTFKWALHPGSDNDSYQHEQGGDVWINSYGHLYLTGNVNGDAYFEDTYIPFDAFQENDFFLAKYDTLANLMWVKTYGNGYNEWNNYPRVTGWGNKVLVAGSINSDGAYFELDGMYNWGPGSGEDYWDGHVALLNDCNAVLSQNGSELTATAGASYKWFLNRAEISGATSQSYTPVIPGKYRAEVTFANGCKSYTQQIEMTLTGLEEASAVAMTLYPNPCTESLQLNLQTNLFSDELKLRIYNANGILVSEEKITGSGNAWLHTLDVSALTSGLYMLEISDDKRKTSRKFIKK